MEIPPDAVAQPVRLPDTPSMDPVDIAQRFIVLEGKPIRYTEREYLCSVLRSPYRKVLLKTARQVEKSTTISVSKILALCIRGHQTGLYVAPRPDHITTFSTGRFKPMILGSPVFRPLIKGANWTVDQVKNKLFTNLSQAYFRVAYLTAEAARGITSDFLAIDELALMLSDHIPIIEATQSHRPAGKRIYAGTPLTFSNPMERYWGRSTQKEWITRCSAGHVQDTGLTMENIGDEGPVCAKVDCKKAINPADGKWRPGVTEAEYDGYHISTPMVPWYRGKTPEGQLIWKEILYARENNPEYVFRNEWLGESFMTGGALLSEEDIYRCCRNYRMTHKRETTVATRSDLRVFLGIDWGGQGKSRTAMAVGAYFDGRFHLLDGYFFDGHDPIAEEKFAIQLAHKWKVSYVMCDAGYGYERNIRLRRALSPIKVSEFQFSGQGDVDLVYHFTRGKYVGSRQKLLRETWTAIKAQEMAFPHKDDMKPFIEDLTSLYAEEDHKHRSVRWDHKGDQTDDFYFALTLARTAWQASAKKIRIVVSKGRG